MIIHCLKSYSGIYICFWKRLKKPEFAFLAENTTTVYFRWLYSTDKLHSLVQT